MRSILIVSFPLLTQVQASGQTPDLLPLDTSQRLTRIALGACVRQGDPQPIWKVIVDSKPELVVFLGDNIYGDSWNMDVLKWKSGQLAADKGFQRLTKPVRSSQRGMTMISEPMHSPKRLDPFDWIDWIDWIDPFDWIL